MNSDLKETCCKLCGLPHMNGTDHICDVKGLERREEGSISVVSEWEKEFDKLWETCSWSEKDGLHPEAFLSRGGEDGEEDSYSTERIKAFIARVRNAAIEEVAETTKDSILEQINSAGGIGGLNHLREIIKKSADITIRSLKS